MLKILTVKPLQLLLQLEESGQVRVGGFHADFEGFNKQR